MDIAVDRAKFTTTVQIPMHIRTEIKSSGMTINGALIAGWMAMKERKEWNREVLTLKNELETYRSRFVQLKMQVRELESEKIRKNA